MWLEKIYQQSELLHYLNLPFPPIKTKILFPYPVHLRVDFGRSAFPVFSYPLGFLRRLHQTLLDFNSDPTAPQLGEILYTSLWKINP